MISALDISTSALIAQRVRLNAISSNIANMSSQRDESGRLQPYQARYVVFQTDDENSTSTGAVGVKVASVNIEQIEPKYRYEPNNPLAIREGRWAGYVAYPNISMTEQFVDAMQATRAYEANIGVIEISKNMSQQSLRILA